MPRRQWGSPGWGFALRPGTSGQVISPPAPGGGPAPAFDPTSVGGCVRWFDFSDNTAGNITAGATAADIAAVRDKVTSAAWWTTGGVASQEPALVTGGAGINGVQSCQFTQSQGNVPVQWLTMMDAISGGANLSLSSNLGGSFSYSLFIVIELGDPNTKAGYAATYNNPGIIAASGYWGFHSDGWVLGTPNPPFWMRAYQYDADQTDKNVELSGCTTGQTLQATMSFTDPGAGLFANLSYYQDGGLVGAVSSKSGYDNPGGGTGWSDELFMGQGWNGAGDKAGWWGKVGEVILYDNEVSGGDRATIETYLKTKWGTP